MFDTPEEAFQAYKQAKEAYIKDVANQYYKDGKITENVYNALMKYKVEITD
jgi:predicted RNase H-like HicB family nuclease